jgi:2-keto-4-pentenoate hydratase/2-oxohepta-3-ene-1,7-dioic acid hydratase in catechol pathway
MRIVRIATPSGPRFARLEDSGFVPIEDPFLAAAAWRTPVDAGDRVDGTIIAPVEPLVVVGIAQNGQGHHSPVQAWLKSPRTVVGTGTQVLVRRDAGVPVAEGEIAVVIARSTVGLTAENAHEFVLGVTAVNDLSSPERGEWDPRNFESKSGDGYTPLGPWIDTDADIDDVELELLVDDAVVCATSSRELPMSIRDCLAYVAAWSPLGPGDIVMTGAPRAQTQVRRGQTVTVRVARMELVTPLV